MELIDGIKNLTRGYLERLAQMKQKAKNLVETNYELGHYHYVRGNLSDAKMRFKMVLYMRPNHHKAMYGLARCMIVDGQENKARELLQKVIMIEPNFVEARYILDCLNKIEPSAIPLSLIREFFEEAADSYYEKYVIDTGHSSYKFISEELFGTMSPERSASIVELGSGVGTLGKYLRTSPLAINVLEAVDMSDNMVNIARKMKTKDGNYIYDRVVNATYDEFFASNQQTYNYVCCDVSIGYLKDPTSIFAKIHSKLQDGSSYFIFTGYSSIKIGQDVHISEDCEHFCYSDNYIVTILKKAGFSNVKVKKIPIDIYNQGFIAIAQK